MSGINPTGQESTLARSLRYAQDAAAMRSLINAAPANNSQQYRETEHFANVSGMSATVSMGALRLFSFASGTGAAFSQLAATVYPSNFGVMRLTTGTTATGIAGVLSGASNAASNIVLGSNIEHVWSCRFFFASLATAAALYLPVIGFFNGFAGGGNSTNGVYLVGSSSSPGQAVGRCRNASVTTDSASLGSFIAGWNDCEIKARSNLATFTLNGVTQTLNTGLPLGTAAMGYGSGVIKTVGTTASLVDIDAVAYEARLF